MNLTAESSRTLNALGMLAVCLVLILAFAYQFALYELPCPLCLLQRVGFVAVGFGLGLNLLYGIPGTASVIKKKGCSPPQLHPTD